MRASPAWELQLPRESGSNAAIRLLESAVQGTVPADSPDR